MAASLRYFALSCFVFLAFQQVVDCITCYECSACSSNSNSWGSTSSGSGSAQCFKYAYTGGPVTYANRGLRDPCTPGSDGSGGTNYCCKTDRCNSGVLLSSSLGFIFALIAAVSLFKTVMAD